MITSTSNALIKWLLKLQEKRKEREAQKLFIIEGLRMFEETPTSCIKEVYVSASFYEKYQEQYKERLQQHKFEILSERVFAHVSDTKSPQGILCVVEILEYTLAQIMMMKPAHILILEDVRDPGNLGTILRSAEGAGVTGIILSANSVDMYNPKTIRSTMGSIYRVPFLYVEELEEVIVSLKQEGVRVFATHLDGEAYDTKEQYQGEVAFLLGNEAKGLSPEVVGLADTKVKIPMQGKVESLNVAIAASVFMFEVSRQRR